MGSRFKFLFVAFSALFLLCMPSSALAQDGTTIAADTAADSTENPSAPIYRNIEVFGGPSSVGGQLREDNEPPPAQYRLQSIQDALRPWYEFKEKLNNDHGLQYGVNWTMLYQAATSSRGENDAFSGIFDAQGQWNLVGRGTPHSGFLVFKGETRDRLGTSITPFDLGFQAGSITPTGTFFNEFDFALTRLFWQQTFCDRRLQFLLGRIDVTDYTDVYALTNPLTGFINLAFSANPTIAFPNQGLGAAAGVFPTDHSYVVASINDANGQPTEAGFDTFFDAREYFTTVEFGLISTFEKRYLGQRAPHAVACGSASTGRCV